MKTSGAILLAALLASPLLAQAEHELVGFTTSTAKGDHRVANMTGLCQADFGSSARMCNDQEILQTTNWPAGLSGSGWVRPDIRGGTELNGTPNIVIGVGASGFQGDPLTLSCNNFSEGTGSGVGLLYSAPGGLLPAFVGKSCADQHPIACCVPTPSSAATVAAFSLWGQGGLALLMLAVAAHVLIRRGPVRQGHELPAGR